MPQQWSAEIYRDVLEGLPVGVYMVDRNRQISFWNKEAERITGYLGQEVIGHFCHENLLMHCDANQTILCGAACPLARTMYDGQRRDAHIFLRHKAGQRVPVRARSIPIRDESGTVIGSAECFEERLTRGGTSSQRIPAGAELDQVTGLPAPSGMHTAIQSALADGGVSRTSFGILCVTIDDLERLRHLGGRQAINEVLYATGQTLLGGTRPEDSVGLWEEGRFAVLVQCGNAANLQSCAERLKRLASVVGVPWWGDRLSITVSIGGTMLRDTDSLETLLQRAGEAFAFSQAQPGNSVFVV